MVVPLEKTKEKPSSKKKPRVAWDFFTYAKHMQNLGKNTANGRRPRLYGSQIHDSLGIPTDDVRRISFIGPDYSQIF